MPKYYGIRCFRLFKQADVVKTSFFKVAFFGEWDAEMLISTAGCTSSSGSSVKEAELHKIRLVNILQGDGFFSDGGSKGVKAYRTAVEKFDYCGKHLSVGGVKT